MARPRLLVPGSIELLPTGEGAQHEILLGDLAGYLLGEDVTNWKNTYTFVALDDLSLDERRRYTPHLAAEWSAIAAGANVARGYRDHLRDGAAGRPHLARLLEHARLLLVGSTDRRELGAAGHVRHDGPHRIVEIGFARHADDYFRVQLQRDGKTLAEVAGAYYSVFADIDREDSEWPGIETRDRLLDRVIRAATNGLADSAQIALAFWMADVADLDGWESHLAAIASRANAHRTLANEVVRLLREAKEDAIALPEYGEARRISLPAFELHDTESKDSLAASVDVAGRPTLSVPAESAWMIAEVDADPVPRPPPEIFRAASITQPARDLRRGCALLGVVLLILVGLFVLGLRGGRLGEPCRDRRDCRSKMCLRFEGAPEAGYCTRTCSRDADCKAGLTCRALLFEGRNVCQR